jgi:hypothetical protein
MDTSEKFNKLVKFTTDAPQALFRQKLDVLRQLLLQLRGLREAKLVLEKDTFQLICSTYENIRNSILSLIAMINRKEMQMVSTKWIFTTQIAEDNITLSKEIQVLEGVVFLALIIANSCRFV